MERKRKICRRLLTSFIQTVVLVSRKGLEMFLKNVMH